MAGGQVEVVAAEASECSRWIMTALSCFACVSFFHISSLMMENRDPFFIMPILAIVPCFLAAAFVIVSMLLLTEQCGFSDHQRRRLADEMLMF
jgi:hypothetical protein